MQSNSEASAKLLLEGKGSVVEEVSKAVKAEVANKELLPAVIRDIYLALFVLVATFDHNSDGSCKVVGVKDISLLRPDFCFLIKRLAEEAGIVGANIENEVMKTASQQAHVKWLHDALGIVKIDKKIDGTVCAYFTRDLLPRHKLSKAERTKYWRKQYVPVKAAYSYRRTRLDFVKVTIPELGQLFDDMLGYIFTTFFPDESEFMLLLISAYTSWHLIFSQLCFLQDNLNCGRSSEITLWLGSGPPSLPPRQSRRSAWAPLLKWRGSGQATLLQQWL
jgi:hypothetical protein